jgi:GNAT superfamily N-acetyltransferase
MDKGAAVTYVLVPAADAAQIAGYFTLSATAIRLDAIPVTVAKQLPRYPLVPATLLGRLAIRHSSRGQGLGRYLLMAALERSLDASKIVASTAVVVFDAKDDAAVTFYRRYDFIPFVDDPRRLFLPMHTIRQVFAEGRDSIAQQRRSIWRGRSPA